MLKSLFKNYIYPIATLSGSIIGVGFLSLPYITIKVGIFVMLFYMAVLTGLVVFLHVIFGQISLRTPDYKRFPGFVGYYLGNFPKMLTLMATVLSSYGLCVIYFIVGSQFLSVLLHPFLNSFLAFLVIVAYFGAGVWCIYVGTKIISRVEFWGLLTLMAIFGVVLVKEFSQMSWGSGGGTLWPVQDWKALFLPYGAIIFSLWGAGMVSEVEEMLTGSKRLLKRVIIIGTLIPAVMYVVFIFLITGISGTATTESSLTGLQQFLGPGMFSLVLCVGLITIFTAFIAQGLFLKKTFVYDLGMGEFLACVLTCVPPLILFVAGFNSFVSLISLMGGVLFGINGIFILMMYRKIGGKKVIVYPLILVFLLGMIYSIVYFVQ